MGVAQHLPERDSGDVLGASMETPYFWKEGSGPSKETGEGKDSLSLAEPHQARSKAPSVLVTRGVAKGKGEK